MPPPLPPTPNLQTIPSMATSLSLPRPPMSQAAEGDSASASTSTSSTAGTGRTAAPPPPRPPPLPNKAIQLAWTQTNAQPVHTLTVSSPTHKQHQVSFLTPNSCIQPTVLPSQVPPRLPPSVIMSPTPPPLPPSHPLPPIPISTPVPTPSLRLLPPSIALPKTPPVISTQSSPLSTVQISALISDVRVTDLVFLSFSCDFLFFCPSFIIQPPPVPPRQVSCSLSLSDLSPNRLRVSMHTKQARSAFAVTLTQLIPLAEV